MQTIIKSEKTLFIIGCLIGLVVFLCIFTFSTLNVTNDSFFASGYMEKDVAQHYSGWMLYRQSGWQFPLGLGQNMAYPYSTSVSYTDSVPLLAIFFKLLSPILPATFQYFGLYMCLCYMLMGGFSALLMQLFTKTFTVSCFAAVLFSLSPIMAERAFRHVALTSHYLIIAMLYFYFKNKGNYSFKSTVPFIIINTLAITIHPYFLPFTFAISFAFYLHWAFSKREIFKPFAFIGVSLVSTLFVGYCIGAFHSIGSAGDIGYGFFSLNINSYINPASNKIPDWSNIMNPRPLYFEYQLEGFNYLGFGIIAALCFAFVVFIINKNIRKQVLYWVKSSLGLVFVTIVLTAFAISSTVVFGGLVLFQFNLPEPLLSLASIFRASGRFGWLLFYLIYIVVIFVISQIKFKFKFLPQILLVAIVLVQIYDILPALQLKNNYFSKKGYLGDGHTVSYGLTDDYWQTAVQDFDKIIALDIGPSIYQGAIDIAILAGKANSDVKVNLAFEARANNENRREFVSKTHDDLVNGNIEDDTLYIVTDVFEYKEHINSGEYKLIKVDGQLLMFAASNYSDAQLKTFDESDTFELVSGDDLSY